jgi:hypothetical protein
MFGGFDGLTSAVGVILGAIVVGTSTRTLFAVGLGLAVAAAVSMGGGEWLADPDSDLRGAAIMVAATFAGSIAPVIPYLFTSGDLAAGIALGVAVVVGAGVAAARRTLASCSTVRAYLSTFAILAGACVLSAGVTAVYGAAG